MYHINICYFVDLFNASPFHPSPNKFNYNIFTNDDNMYMKPLNVSLKTSLSIHILSSKTSY